MQTFLPFPDFEESAQCLDDKRLGKQRVECMQILATLFGESDGWENHPAVLMWENHEGALLLYAYAILDEWEERGFNDTVRDQISSYEPQIKESAWEDPSWIGDMEFHNSHRSNLLRKDYEHYKEYFPGIPDDLEYVWPVQNTNGT